MLEDGNCLFRAVADQVYGDSEAYYDLTRQMCIDYMVWFLTAFLTDLWQMCIDYGFSLKMGTLYGVCEKFINFLW